MDCESELKQLEKGDPAHDNSVEDNLSDLPD